MLSIKNLRCSHSPEATTTPTSEAASSGVQSTKDTSSGSSQAPSPITPASSQFCYNLNISEGQWVAISGASGVGKSSLLLAIAGLIPARAETLSWQGSTIQTLSPAKRPVALLFQQHNLFSHLSVRHNLALINAKGFSLKTILSDQAMHWLERLGLMPFIDKTPKELSGGQQQRVAIIRALLQNKPLLLLDEPLTGLDRALREQTLALFEQLNQENALSILMITHHPAELSSKNVIHLTMSQGGGTKPRLIRHP